MVLGVSGMAALAADDATTGPDDGTTDSTVVAPTEPAGEVEYEGEIKISAISFDRTVTKTAVVYYFTYSGPGTADFEYDDPNGCLVSFTDVVDSAMKYCAF